MHSIGQKTKERGTTTRAASRSRRQPQYLNRELSWLNFNARVLAEANNPIHPLLERLKFLAIFSNNLDEFFMIHIPGMRDRADEETGKHLADEEVRDKLRAMHDLLKPLLHLQNQYYNDIMGQVAEHGIKLHTFNELSAEQKRNMKAYFEEAIFPVLTPLVVGPGHPFPYISNLSLSLAVIVRDPHNGKEHFARVKVPTHPVLPRFVPLEGIPNHFVLLEEVVAAHIDRLFLGMEVRATYPFRITRNADLELPEDETDDLMDMIEQKLQRRRFGEVERVEVSANMPESVRKKLLDEMEEVLPEEMYSVHTPLNMADFFFLAGLDLPALKDKPFSPGIPSALRNSADTFTAIRQGDIMLHHPYQSFACVSEFIRRAAYDPQVLAIKHTLYRTSGDSPILQALIDAADNGKQVVCLVELKARFDEANNIVWAKQLEKSGVHVVYGWLGLKTHCKVTLVVRREENGLRRYVHVGTGNYNPRTAKVYTDISLLTCSPEFGADATDLFNFLTGLSRQEAYRRYSIAPLSLRNDIKSMIEREIAHATPERPGRIIAKMNALVDLKLIQQLYRASQHGVRVDLIIRGMCCLRPGVAGLSENIRVVSVVGRFLEHSRIFYFENQGSDEVYIGSADWMTRNLDRRVEVVVPVEAPELRRQLKEQVLEVMLKDNCQAWELDGDGNYTRCIPSSPETRFSAQEYLLEKLTH
jgi:polyphosphate kinase